VWKWKHRRLSYSNSDEYWEDEIGIARVSESEFKAADLETNSDRFLSDLMDTVHRCSRGVKRVEVLTRTRLTLTLDLYSVAVPPHRLSVG